MSRSSLLAVLATVLVVGAVGVFAIYTFGWRDTHSSDGGSARARADAAVFMTSQCSYDDAKRCRISSVRHLGGPVWEARVVSAKGQACIVVDVSRFAVYYSPSEDVADRFHGAGWSACRREP